jgi:hypothetical protein
VAADTIALEIGPGRGAWTKALLPAREVWVLDALSAEHNGFWQYVGPQSHVRYHQVTDFTCSMLPEDRFTYLFSFGTLCHIPFDGIAAYSQSIFPKLRAGAKCFWMIADLAHRNRVMGDERYSVIRTMPAPFRRLLSLKRRLVPGNNLRPISDESQTAVTPRWYYAGVERTCDLLRATGYTVIDTDVGTCLRDPIIWFRKP